MTTLPRLRSAFLIHSHADRKEVHDLYKCLSRDGIKVWMDVESLQPGQDWRREIHKAILKSDVAVVCLSVHFNKQEGYRHEELRIALEKTKFISGDEVSIIPIRLTACDMPESLQHLHRVDLFERGGYRKLLLALQGQAGKPFGRTAG
ncbi:MAG: toll/interleukin-1 receptor domain-containing protein [Anaerolineales bacterium]|nr:toll/interleukin-1 receptor domain-containing protein [Anaerolineales bacterium]